MNKNVKNAVIWSTYQRVYFVNFENEWGVVLDLFSVLNYRLHHDTPFYIYSDSNKSPWECHSSSIKQHCIKQEPYIDEDISWNDD